MKISQQVSHTLIFVIVSSLPLLSLSVKCNANDKKVLLQIKNALNNPYHLASWNPETDCCSWYAMSCDPTSGRVNQLTIFQGNISGQIPPQVGDLPYLNMIDFNHLTNLTGQIPASITKLTRLTFLRLSRTNLSGPIPSFLGQMKSLTFLDLSFNDFSGEIPQSMVDLKLQSLDVSYNGLCGKIPSGGSLQKFESTAYSHNKCLCGAPLPACK